MKFICKLLPVLAAAGAIAASAPNAMAQTAGTNAAAAKPSGVVDMPDPVIAKGKGFEIKRSKLDEALVSIKASAAAQGTEISRPELAQIEKKLLDRLIQIRILTAKATADDKVKGKEEADKRLALIRKRAPSEETFVRQLRAAGLTPETLRDQLIEEATSEAVLRTRVKVAEEKVKKYYDDNPSRTEISERVRINYLTLGLIDPATNTPLPEEQKKAKKKLADELLQRARKGEDFAKLARDNSDDVAARESGGEATLGRGLSGVPPDFEAAAFALKTNQVSEVIVTQYAYFIIKCAEKIPARKVDYVEAAPVIRKELEDAEIVKMLPEYYQELKKEANVEILDEKLKAIQDDPPKPAGGK